MKRAIKPNRSSIVRKIRQIFLDVIGNPNQLEDTASWLPVSLIVLSACLALGLSALISIGLFWLQDSLGWSEGLTGFALYIFSGLIVGAGLVAGFSLAYLSIIIGLPPFLLFFDVHIKKGVMDKEYERAVHRRAELSKKIHVRKNREADEMPKM